MNLREQAAAAKTDTAALRLVVDALHATRDAGMVELADATEEAVEYWDAETAEDEYGCATIRELLSIGSFAPSRFFTFMI